MVIISVCVKETHPGNVSLAQRYLENKVSSGAVVSNYSLSLVAYTLALASSPVAGAALDELHRRADYRGNVGVYFMFSNVQKSHKYSNTFL